MTVELMTEHHLALLSLKGGCTGSSESSLVKIPQCWKSHVAAHYNGLYQGNTVNKLLSFTDKLIRLLLYFKSGSLRLHRRAGWNVLMVLFIYSKVIFIFS